MLYALILFAQEGEGGAQGPFGNSIMMLLPILLAIFYFTVILPGSRKQRKEQESLMTGLKKNDEVVTSAGIIGIVAHIKENGDEVTLKIDDNARLRVLKSSIVRIVSKDAPASASANTSIKPAT
jgi:preprotein translocase subunit YajC